MSARLIHTGIKYNDLIPINYVYTKNTHAYWECRCTRCGNITTLPINNLVSGNTKSCCRYMFGNDTVMSIRERVANGETIVALAKEYKCTRSAIYSALKRTVHLCTGGTL